MTSKKKLITGAAAGIAVLGLAFAATALRAQKSSEPGPGDEINALIVPGGESWLGVTLKDVTAEQASSLKLNGVYGALVDHVEPDSPAA